MAHIFILDVSPIPTLVPSHRQSFALIRSAPERFSARKKGLPQKRVPPALAAWQLEVAILFQQDDAYVRKVVPTRARLWSVVPKV